ncbi:UNVERIFIED_ORG: hypothetical protein GGE44_001053 [Rhizobium esperanzae]
MVKEPSEFFASANGDRWYLEQGDGSAEQTVIHRANPASGGAETRWSVFSFLQVAGDHPQGQALRDTLAETRFLEIGVACDPAVEDRGPPTLYPWTPKTKVGED